MARRRRARGGESKNAPRRPQAELVALHPSPWPPPPPLLYRPPGGPWLVATAQHGTAGLSFFFFFFPGASGPAGPRRRRPILHWQGSSELQLTAAAEDRGGGRRRWWWSPRGEAEGTASSSCSGRPSPCRRPPLTRSVACCSPDFISIFLVGSVLDLGVCWLAETEHVVRHA